MPTKRRTKNKFDIAERRKRCAQMYRLNLSQAEIAVSLGVDAGTVSRDIKYLRDKANEVADNTYEDARAEFIQRLLEDEQEIMQQYRLSAKKTKRKDPLTDEMIGIRDTSILARLEPIRVQLAKVLGLYAPDRHVVESDSIQVVMDA